MGGTYRIHTKSAPPSLGQSAQSDYDPTRSDGESMPIFRYQSDTSPTPVRTPPGPNPMRAMCCQCG